MNMRKEYEELRKALDITTTNGNSVLQPTVLSDAIVTFTQLQPNIRNYIKRTPWPSMTYNWDNRYQSGSAASTSYDGATIAFSDSKFSRGSNPLSQIYSLFQITNAAREGAQATLLDILQDELSERVKQLVRTEDAYIVSGDPNNSVGNPGLIAQTTGTQPTTAYGGNGLTLSHALMDNIETAQNAAGYEVDAWFVSKGIYALLKTVSYNSVRMTNITPESEVMIGYAQGPTKALMFNMKPVVLDPNLYINGHDNAIAVSLNPLNLVTAVFKEPTVEEFVNVQPQFDGNSYRVKEYCTTVLKNPYSAVLLSNVVIPASTSF